MGFHKCKILVSAIALGAILLTPLNAAEAEIFDLDSIGLKIDSCWISHRYTSSESMDVKIFTNGTSIAALSGLKNDVELKRIYDKYVISLIHLPETEIRKALEENKDLNYYVLNTGRGDVFVYKSAKKKYTNLQKALSTAIDTPDVIKSLPNNNFNSNSQILAKYSKYYDINPDTFEIQYKPLSKEEKKKLYKSKNKEAINEYKKVKKIQDYIEYEYYFDALKIDKDFLPTYIYMYNNAMNKKLCGNALFALNKLKEVNKTENIFNDNIMNYHLGLLNYIFGDGEKIMDYLQPYTSYAPETNNQYLSWLFANYNFEAKNYSTAIFYANQVRQTSSFKEDSYVLEYECYKKLNNKQKIKECLEKLVQINPTTYYYNELATYYPTEKSKQTIYKEARNALHDKNFNDKIIKYEQAKISNATKAFSGYYEKPDWNNYVAYFSRHYYYDKVYQYQDLFYDSTNICIVNYKGQNLKSCFEGVKKKFDKLTDDINKQYYSKLEYDRQKSLRDDIISSQEDMIDDLKDEIESLKRKINYR